MVASTSTSTAADTYYADSYYDVFINHRGPDVKKTLASHLYRRLISYGLRVFLDKEEMQEGENLNSQIQNAIRTASVHVAIFSSTYAESPWCLDELLQMLESGTPIIPVFYHVRPDHLRWTQGKDGVYAQALHKLEMKKTQEFKRRYDTTTIENWRNALSRVAQISGLDLEAFNGDEGELLDKVVEGVLKKRKKTHLNVAEYPTGLDETVKDFETKVLSQQQNGKIQVVGIVGLGGVGKTTLAKEFFNRKSSSYNKSYFLSEVRENAAKSSLESLQSRLLRYMMHLDLHIDNSHQGIEMISKHLLSSQVLLVLDDVDHVDQVNALLPPKFKDVLHSSSLILITSRDKNVLARSGVQESSIYLLNGLDLQHSRELLCSYAFSKPHPLPGFEYLVGEFVKACNRLPLSLKVFGGLLKGNNDKEYWKVQLDRLQQTLPNEIQKTLQISYDALHREEQQIFLDIVCFFIGENVDTAIRIWEGSGWKGLVGFQNLQNKCLVEVDSSNEIKMHGHLRDMGKEIVEASGLQRCLRLQTENTGDVLHRSDVINEVRGIKTVLRGHGDHLEYKCFCLEMSWYRSHELLRKQAMKLRNRVHNRKLQLLDIEGGHLECILRRVHSPNIVWLRWQECPYYSLPSWIPMDNLTVLQVFGGVLKTLWPGISQDYKEAARIRDALKVMEDQEPALRLLSLLKKAISEERFEDAAKYRNELELIAPDALLKCFSDTTTLGIRVQVRSVYVKGRSQPSKGQYFFAYRIRISNCCNRPVQLLRRHWAITDAVGKTEHIWGIGVIGEQPVLLPGTSFEYSSACPLGTATGKMEGDFGMKYVDKVSSDNFTVLIGPFALSVDGDEDSI